MSSVEQGRRTTAKAHAVSVLGDAPGEYTAGERDYFEDLSLNQIREALTVGREEYDVAQFFDTPLRDPAAVEFRQAVVAELERPEVAAPVQAFAKGMRTVRARLKLARELHDVHQSERWFVAAVARYCEATIMLERQLRTVALESDGLQGLHTHIRAYVRSQAFADLEAETLELERGFAAVRYTVHIKGLRVVVAPYAGQTDLGREVEEVFAKFREEDAESHLVRFPAREDTTLVEERVLARVAKLHPELFTNVAEFITHRADHFIEPVIGRFDREVQFYLAYLDYIAPLRAAGLRFSLPRVSDADKRVQCRDTFDLALAHKLVSAGTVVIGNDLELGEHERIVVITGPNQGGKTTYARMFGQLHHLAALGLAVPGADARLFLPDRIFTHFEREENLDTLRGKFEDELVRVHEILTQATPDSLLVMNESFSSTTLHDACWVGERVVRQIVDRGMLCLYVTFVDELASLDPVIVSMMSTVDPDDPAERTFKVVRKPADGLAYAVALAEKHGISYRALRRRLRR